ncbi:MAG: potassium transporter TrkH [Bacteroidetes bacterium QS_7_67_15]|nr:MAG: potassium transporter TrkH [Bacteroidetes bacterium QS_7_67_15]
MRAWFDYDSQSNERTRRRNRHSYVGRAWRALSPPQLFAGSFLTLILLGTVGFKTLPGLYAGPALSWLDALFTATSAICVTGLIVVDTATYFTFWGQAYILFLIQIGGLGMITFTTIIISTLGRRLSVRHETLAEGPAEIVPDIGYRDLAWAATRFTFITEAVGAVLLYLCWVPRFGWEGAPWPSVFHAISAFCNAGFSTFTASLMPFRENVPLLCVVMALIVAGGLGFLTLEEVYRWGRAGRAGRERRFRLSVHSQLVLVTTAVLIVGGWGLFTVFEWGNTLAGLPLVERLANGLFASVTPRTAGFNTIDYGEALPSTNFLTMLFMSVGGSPGSMAGGVKTTTAALLVLMAWARLRGRVHVNVSSRTLPRDTINRAMSVFVVAFGIVTAGIYGMTLVDLESVFASATEGGFLEHMFEAVSALNTVGLSMGATGNLTAGGKVITIVLMYVGRVGPLSLAAAVSRSQKRGNADVRLAQEDVAVG